MLGPEVPVSAPRAALGESFGASTLMGLVGAVAATQAGSVPPTAGFEKAASGARVRVAARAETAPGDLVLVNGTSSHGHHGSILLKVKRKHGGEA